MQPGAVSPLMARYLKDQGVQHSYARVEAPRAPGAEGRPVSARPARAMEWSVPDPEFPCYSLKAPLPLTIENGGRFQHSHLWEAT